MDLALFDLDETLICEDSTGLWLRWLISQGFAPPSLLAREEALMAQYHQGTLSISDYMALTLSPLEGLHTVTVAGWIRRFIQRDILPRVYPAASERPGWHQQRGDRIVVISASGEHLVKPIARLLGADDALAIGVEIIDNRYSGNTHGVMSYREGKVARLQHWINEQAPFAFEHSWAYSDSLNNLPLLEYVSHAAVINPGDELRQLAQQRNWSICHWQR